MSASVVGSEMCLIDSDALEYGKSITDACLGWDDSLQSLAELAAAVKARRGRAAV